MVLVSTPLKSQSDSQTPQSTPSCHPVSLVDSKCLFFCSQLNGCQEIPHVCIYFSRDPQKSLNFISLASNGPECILILISISEEKRSLCLALPFGQIVQYEFKDPICFYSVLPLATFKTVTIVSTSPHRTRAILATKPGSRVKDPFSVSTPYSILPRFTTASW